MRRNYFVKLIRYMKKVYSIENGLNKLTSFILVKSLKGLTNWL
ncbi:hypothetical protein B0P06_000545 [Clostridium saccharoperbutylacetonicum]|nr:hypothetical protein [Clostridium saccharoperbutylacetonicum]NSB27288.1 hypothetical protein [Clostridium saccharoperbutylacetonicum]NSB40774.1 hypothetical protein [Clostridium saccharoperbutylacetonicum]